MDETAEKLKLMSLVSVRAVFNSDVKGCTNESFLRTLDICNTPKTFGDFEVSSHLRCQIIDGVDAHQKTSGHGSCHHCVVDTFHHRISVNYRNSYAPWKLKNLDTT